MGRYFTICHETPEFYTDKNLKHKKCRQNLSDGIFNLFLIRGQYKVKALGPSLHSHPSEAQQGFQ